MIGLFDTGFGAFPLADIKAIQHVDQAAGQAEHYRLHRTSGAPTLTVFPHDYIDLMMRPVQIMPAESGTRLVAVYSAPFDEVAIADTEPVLAWALCMDGQVRPILPSGVRRGYRFNDQNVWHPDYVQMPDGSLYQYGIESDPGAYASVDEVVAAETQRLRRHEAERQRQRAERQDGEGLAA